MRKLKRCPFCGSEPYLLDFTQGQNNIDKPMAWVECFCGVSFHSSRSRAHAIARWNRRKEKPDTEMCQECGMKPAVFHRWMYGRLETQIVCPHCRRHTAWQEDECDAIDEWNAGGDR